MAIFNEIYSDSFYLLTESEEKLFPYQQKNRKTRQISFRVGRESSHNSLTHKDPTKRVLELDEHEMFDYVINQGAFARFHIPMDEGLQSNYRSIHSSDIKDVVIHPCWLHLKK